MNVTILLILVVAAWIGCGPVLAWFMGRRGYDAFSWLAVGAILGPSAVAMAVMERWSWRPPLPEVVVRGTDLGGDVHILMSIDPGESVVDVARPLLQSLHGHVGRITVARVLPEGGPGAGQDRARHEVAREAGAIEGAEGVLLFGRADEVLRTKAVNEGYHFVVGARRDDRLERALAGGRIRYLAGGADVRRLPCRSFRPAAAPWKQTAKHVGRSRH